MSSYNTASVKIGDIVVKVGSRCYRPLYIDVFLANMTKAKTKLGCIPKITVEQISLEMVENDLDSSKRRDLLK
jgi:GDPmannose 4,6-dehydratase